MFFILIIICLKLSHKIPQHLYRKYSPLMPKTKEEQPIHMFELFSYITVRW